jgi:hypothetical protein
MKSGDATETNGTHKQPVAPEIRILRKSPTPVQGSTLAVIQQSR